MTQEKTYRVKHITTKGTHHSTDFSSLDAAEIAYNVLSLRQDLAHIELIQLTPEPKCKKPIEEIQATNNNYWRELKGTQAPVIYSYLGNEYYIYDIGFRVHLQEYLVVYAPVKNPNCLFFREVQDFKNKFDRVN